MANLKFDNDADVHKNGSLECAACVGEYPHEHDGCIDGGWLHAEYHYTIEAGFKSRALLKRCDSDRCGYELCIAAPEVRIN